MMTRLNHCNHRLARFFAVQQLGGQRPVELWQCPECKSTVSVDGVRDAAKRNAAAC